MFCRSACGWATVPASIAISFLLLGIEVRLCCTACCFLYQPKSAVSSCQIMHSPLSGEGMHLWVASGNQRMLMKSVVLQEIGVQIEEP